MKENTEQLSSEEKQYRKMTEEPVCRLIMKLGRFNRYIFAADNGLIFPSPHREEHI